MTLYILAVNTAQQPGSVALLRDETVCGEIVFADGVRGGVGLSPAVEELLKLAPGGRVDLVATALGPGSYTGSRLGLAYATFFAFGRGVPLIAVCDLAALAAAEGADGERIAAGIVAHDGKIFGAVYTVAAEAEPLESAPPTVLLPEAFAALACTIGARVVLAPPSIVPASAIGRVAARKFARTGVGDDPVLLEPLYLQPASPERAVAKSNPMPTASAAAAATPSATSLPTSLPTSTPTTTSTTKLTSTSEPPSP